MHISEFTTGDDYLSKYFMVLSLDDDLLPEPIPSALLFPELAEESALRLDAAIADKYEAFAASTRAVTASVSDNAHTGIMLALPLSHVMVAPPESLPGDALPQTERHTTMSYFGSNTSPDAPSLVDIQTALESFDFSAYLPLSGEVGGGLGVFYTPDGRAYYLNVDVVGLAELTVDLERHLGTYGVFPMSGHGKTPHMTLTYVKGDEIVAPYAERTPFTVDKVWLSYGMEQFYYPGESAFEHNNFEERVVDSDQEAFAEEMAEWESSTAT